jgi:mRNA interferase RelE/StbE
MTPQFSHAFIKRAKKLTDKDRHILDEAVNDVLDNPELGDMKVGDLSGFRVHKFKMNRQEVLLAYRFYGDTIGFLLFGSHENFYRDLKRQ